MFDFFENFNDSIHQEGANKFYDIYFSLTATPYNIIIPLGLSLILFFSAFHFASKRSRVLTKYDALNIFLFTHLIYVILMFFLIIGLFLLIKSISFFWFVSFIFYGIQTIIPFYFLLIGLLSFSKAKYVIVDSFGNLPRYLKIILLSYCGIVLLISAYATFVEPYWIEVTHKKFDMKGMEEEFRIVQLADIQTDYIGRREQKVVEIVKELKPDLIVLSGDYFSGGVLTHPDAFRSARYVLENLSAPYGIYAVSSDSNLLEAHEPLFQGLAITYLKNASVEIPIGDEKINIVGICRREPDVAQAFKGVDPKSNIILNYHGPEIFFNETVLENKPDLILVGHTHGSQIALPILGPITSGTKYGRKYARGWFEKDGVNMYVNRGIGLEGSWTPKIRFFARPEIAVIDVY